VLDSITPNIYPPIMTWSQKQWSFLQLVKFLERKAQVVQTFTNYNICKPWTFFEKTNV